MKKHGKENEFLNLYGFTKFLRLQGFGIGVDTHLDLQRLLAGIKPEESGYEELKTLLCPIFARNAEEQVKFYDLYDSYFPKLKETEGFKAAEAENAPEEAKEKRLPKENYFRRNLYWIIPLFLFFLSGVSYCCKDCYVYKTTTNCTCISQMRLQDGKPQEVDLKPAKDKDEQKGQNLIVADDGQNSDPIENAKAENETKTANNTVTGQNGSVQPGRKSLEETAIEGLEATWIQRNLYQIKWLAVSLLGLGFFLYWLIQYNSKKVVLGREKKKQPANKKMAWNIELGNAPAISMEKSFYDASDALRRRQQSNAITLDIERTIHSTIQNQGYTTLQYRRMTKPTDYLVLIDNDSYKNHQSLLFEYFTESLIRQDIHIDKYYYTHDPRICWNNANPKGLYVADLAAVFPEHRLIVFGNGHELVDPATAKLASWADIFEPWRHRAVLTPTPPSAWGYHEIALAEGFVLLPATLEGLTTLVDHFELLKGVDLAQWKWKKSVKMPLLEGESCLESLYDYFDNDDSGKRPALRNLEDQPIAEAEAMMKWVSVTALYPELYWDLTLNLGKQLAVFLKIQETDLLAQHNVMKLTRLPWFKDGNIPDDMRERLIGRLSEEEEEFFRRKILDLLQESMPAAEIDADAFNMNLLMQEIMLAKDSRRLEALEYQLQDMIEETPPQQGMVLKYAESRASKLNFLIPVKLRDYFYKAGMPFLGLKNWAKITFASAALLLLFGVFSLLTKPKRFELDDKTYMLDSRQDSAIMLNYLGANQYAQHGALAAQPNGPFYFEAHQLRINDLDISSDGQNILSCSADGTVKMWDLEGKNIRNLIGHARPVNTAKFSKDGRYVVSASNDGLVKIWDIKDKNGKSVIDLIAGKAPDNGNADAALYAEFSNEGSRVLAVYESGAVKIWDTRGKLIAQSLAKDYKPLSARFSLDGNLLAVSAESEAHLFQVGNDTLIYRITLDGGLAQFDPLGTEIAVATKSGIEFYKIDPFEKGMKIPFKGKKSFLRLSPEGNLFAASDLKGQTGLFDSEGNKLFDLDAPMQLLEFSEDGKILVAVNGTHISVWDIASAFFRIAARKGEKIREPKRNISTIAFNQGVDAFEKGDFEKALVLFGRPEVRAEFMPDALHAIGLSYYYSGEMTKGKSYIDSIKAVSEDYFRYVKPNLEELPDEALLKQDLVVEFDTMQNLSFFEGLAKVAKDGKYGYVNAHFELVIPYSFDEAGNFENGKAGVKSGDESFLIDKTGVKLNFDKTKKNAPEKTVEAVIFDGFYDGLARAKKGNQYGFVDRAKNEIVPFVYDNVYNFQNGFAIVKKGDKYGLIGEKGNIVIKVSLDEAKFAAKGYLAVQVGKQWGYFRQYGNSYKLEVPVEYQEVGAVGQDGRIAVKNNGLWGFYHDQKQVIPYQYDEALPFQDGMAKVRTFDTWFFINEMGNCVRDCADNKEQKQAKQGKMESAREKTELQNPADLAWLKGLDEAWADLIKKSLGKSRSSRFNENDKDRVASMTNLNAYGAKITSLGPITRIPFLQVINLKGTAINDLRPLAKLPYLSALDISETAVTDLSPLYKLKFLKTLNCAGSSVGMDEIDKIKKAMPKLTLVY